VTHATRAIGLAFLLLLAAGVRAAEVIPPAPPDHFNDYAGIVEAGAAQQLNGELAQFERDTSNQIVVAIYPHMQSDSSIEDYTVRVAQAWGVGQKERKNGAVLFVFSQDRKLFIQVGYGLEGALPDALCKRIIEDEITPQFRNGDFTAGMAAGVHALMAAARGEYRGAGRTARDARDARGGNIPTPIFLLVILAIIAGSIFARRRNTVYYRGGRRALWLGGMGGFGSSGGNWGGGGGGGSFSGGGGSFGGGGAGGSW